MRALRIRCFGRRLISEERVKPRAPFSYRFRLVDCGAGHTTPASRRSPRWPLSARTKPRTTGLLTGRGKVMQACWPAICEGGGRMAAIAAPDGKGVFPLWVIFHPPHLIPATVSVDINRLPEWKAPKTPPAPTRGHLGLPLDKR